MLTGEIDVRLDQGIGLVLRIGARPGTPQEGLDLRRELFYALRRSQCSRSHIREIDVEARGGRAGKSGDIGDYDVPQRALLQQFDRGADEALAGLRPLAPHGLSIEILGALAPRFTYRGRFRWDVSFRAIH